MIWLFRFGAWCGLFFYADLVLAILLTYPILILALILSSNTATVIIDRLQ